VYGRHVCIPTGFEHHSEVLLEEEQIQEEEEEAKHIKLHQLSHFDPVLDACH